MYIHCIICMWVYMQVYMHLGNMYVATVCGVAKQLLASF